MSQPSSNFSSQHDSPQDSLSIRIKSILFFLLYNLMGIVHSVFCVLLAPFMTFEQRYRFVNLWSRATMWLLRVLNGVHIEVIGAENIPKGQSVVVMANHQSQWETFFLQILISPQATILKRELLWVPFFGWGVALLKPIAINRSQPASALKTILRVGTSRLNDGINVVIYPEGTRQATGTLGKFNSGGAMLAARAKVPVLPVVHNSGDCWPARSMLRRPGKITLVIGQPISSENTDAKSLNAKACQWIEENYPGKRITKT
ncbi:MAG: lysophospholipid acyltransferase family protein [Alcanivoracaceae bacterium]|nr:lysophospholipid acyltransferase family protein [Alcanivoracaceae bacterium]